MNGVKVKCVQNGAFESSLATDIEKELIKHIQFTNVDTDSGVKVMKYHSYYWKLRQMGADRFKTLFYNNSQALLPTASPSYSSSTISCSSSSLNFNINPPKSTPPTVASQDIASFGMSTTSTDDTLTSTVEFPRVRLPPLRFRHSTGSPKLAMSSNYSKLIERDTVTNNEESSSNSLRYCPGQFNYSANNEIPARTLLEPITGPVHYPQGTQV